MHRHPRQTSDAELLRAIQDALPFPVYLTKRAGSLRSVDRRRLAKAGQKVMATDVINGESIAGISLVIPLDSGREVAVISLTGVRVEPRNPLYKEIKAYQLNRIASLAEQRLQAARSAPAHLRLGSNV